MTRSFAPLLRLLGSGAQSIAAGSHGITARAAVSVLLLALTCSLQAEPVPTRRIALIIGNDDYQQLSRLGNPSLDARRLAGILERHGFEVVACQPQQSGCYNLDSNRFRDALATFRAKARRADLALLYFAGHGFQVNEGNVLAPIDMQWRCADETSSRGILFRDLQDAMKPARQRVMILDACRNDPLPQCPQSRGAAARGFQQFEFDEESITIVSSTLPSKTASDGDPGRHSPYARELFEWIETAPWMTFTSLFLNVQKHVIAQTTSQGRRQVPEFRSLGEPLQGCVQNFECAHDARARTTNELGSRE